MTPTTFDVHQAVKDLEKAGAEEATAEAYIAVIHAIVKAYVSNLATTEDIRRLEKRLDRQDSRMDGMAKDIEGLSKDIKNMETSTNIRFDSLETLIKTQGDPIKAQGETYDAKITSLYSRLLLGGTGVALGVFGIIEIISRQLFPIAGG